MVLTHGLLVCAPCPAAAHINNSSSAPHIGRHLHLLPLLPPPLLLLLAPLTLLLRVQLLCLPQAQMVWTSCQPALHHHHHQHAAA